MDFSKLSDKEILDIANPLMENLMDGSSEHDYEKHSKDFTERLKNIVTKENLEKQLRENKLGEFTKRELISIIRKKNSVFVLWKQWLSKSTDEFLAEIVIVEKDGKYLVDHNWIR
jgi:hypothetical protein